MHDGEIGCNNQMREGEVGGYNHVHNVEIGVDKPVVVG